MIFEQAKDNVIQEITSLVRAGVHFGHRTNRWNPKMLPLLYNVRNKSHIIDVLKSYGFLLLACYFCQSARTEGQEFLFVSTKKQTAGIVSTEAQRCGAYHVTFRWLGGILTNWETMLKRLDWLRTLDRWERDKVMLRLGKKEASQRMRERKQLTFLFSGIRNMEKVPNVIFLVDQLADFTALKETKSLGLTTISLLDSNSNPDLVTVGIPANDDALSSISYITKKLSDSIISGMKMSGPSTSQSENVSKSNKPLDLGETIERGGNR